MSLLAPQSAPAEAIGGQVAMLAEYFNAGLEPHVLRLYVDALRDVPMLELRAACKRLVLRATFMPKVAEILAAVETNRTEAHEAEQRRRQDVERRERRAPMRTFGRMSKNAVAAHFGGFMADERCTCVPCFDAQVSGPPRFVPDGVAPAPNCALCDDTGAVPVSERTATTAPSFRKCACVGANNNLVPSTRDHTIEMGRWLHGEELCEHEQAQAAFEAAMRGVMERARRMR